MAGTNYAVAPGEYLEEWVDEHGLSLQAAAGLLGYSHEQVNEIISGRVPITAETATRLARVTGITARSWLRYESAYSEDLKRRSQGHWSRYLPGTGWAYRYRQCTCGLLIRNTGQRPLLHKGRKHR